MGKEINWENLMEFSAEERQDFIVDEATEIRDDLKNNKENPIVTSSPKSKSSSKYPQPIPPYIGSGEIKLIIIGQDPTVGSIATRKKIKTTLMLDDKKCRTHKVYRKSKICKASRPFPSQRLCHKSLQIFLRSQTYLKECRYTQESP